jgi:TFIIF-interacting CTD phosphatase-like protein
LKRGGAPSCLLLRVQQGTEMVRRTDSWFDDAEDGELLELLCFLETLVDADDVRPFIARQFGLREKIATSEPG